MAEPLPNASHVLDQAEGFITRRLDRDFDRVWLHSLRQQAEFGWRRLNAEAAALGAAANLLEIGGGPFLLSMLFAANGYQVVTLEPKGSGFQELRRIQDAVLSFCESEGIRFRILDRRIEDFDWRDQFDLAYSVNVFEHIEDVEAGLRNAMAALRAEGALRVLCANYTFPYEPHFGIPVVIDKKTTGRLFSHRIAGRESELQSAGLWESLNFISVRQLRRICHSHVWPVRFDRSVTLDLLRRFQFDESLRKRHAALAPFVDRVLQMGFGGAISSLPARFQPYMDARITKHAESTA